MPQHTIWVESTVYPVANPTRKMKLIWINGLRLSVIKSSAYGARRLAGWALSQSCAHPSPRSRWRRPDAFVFLQRRRLEFFLAPRDPLRPPHWDGAALVSGWNTRWRPARPSRADRVRFRGYGNWRASAPLSALSTGLRHWVASKPFFQRRKRFWRKDRGRRAVAPPPVAQAVRSLFVVALAEQPNPA